MWAFLPLGKSVLKGVGISKGWKKIKKKLYGAGEPDREPISVANLQAERFDSNEEARPVPYIAGTNRLPVMWASPAYNSFATPIIERIKTGKRKKNITTGYTYQADLIGIICMGTVDEIHSIYMAGNLAWTGNIKRSQSPGDSVQIEIDNYGTITFFWGTQTQSTRITYKFPDPISGPESHVHPPYKGICYALFSPFIFGDDVVSAPNVEFVLFRNTQCPNIENIPVNGGVTCVNVAMELLTNKQYGLGLDPSLLGVTSDILKMMRDEKATISPTIFNTDKVQQLLTQIFDYNNGFISFRDEKYVMDSVLFRKFQQSVPAIRKDQLTDLPVIKIDAQTTASSCTKIIYSDKRRDYKEAVITINEPGMFFTNNNFTGDSVTIERPWINDFESAQKVAVIVANQQGIPSSGGSIVVLENAVITLRIGDSFDLLNVDDQSGRCFCTAKRFVNENEVEIDYKFDKDYISHLSDSNTTTDPEDISNNAPISGEYTSDYTDTLIMLPEELSIIQYEPTVRRVAVLPVSVRKWTLENKSLLSARYFYKGLPGGGSTFEYLGYTNNTKFFANPLCSECYCPDNTTIVSYIRKGNFWMAPLLLIQQAVVSGTTVQTQALIAQLNDKELAYVTNFNLIENTDTILDNNPLINGFKGRYAKITPQTHPYKLTLKLDRTYRASMAWGVPSATMVEGKQAEWQLYPLNKSYPKINDLIYRLFLKECISLFKYAPENMTIKEEPGYLNVEYAIDREGAGVTIETSVISRLF